MYSWWGHGLPSRPLRVRQSCSSIMFVISNMLYWDNKIASQNDLPVGRISSPLGLLPRQTSERKGPWSLRLSKMVHNLINSPSFTKNVYQINSLEMIKTMRESPRSSSPTRKLCETHTRPLNLSFSKTVSQASSKLWNLWDELSRVLDKAAVKCLSVAAESFVARNNMNGLGRLLWYGVSHISIVIPLYNPFFDARLGGDTQETN